MLKLKPADLREQLSTLGLWQHDEPRGTIRREFVFSDFAHAFAFMAQVAMYAEKHDHHPEWSNVWNRVDITLTTHDAGGLSQRDIDLARYADAAYARFADRPAAEGIAPCSGN